MTHMTNHTSHTLKSPAVLTAVLPLFACAGASAEPLYGCPGFTAALCAGSSVATTLMTVFQWIMLVVVSVGLAVTIAGFVMAFLRRFTAMRPASLMTWRMYLTFFLFLIGMKTGYDLAPLGGYMFTALFLLTIVCIVKLLWFMSNLKKGRG